MQLYSGILSPFSAKVRIALAEKGLGFEIREIPWSRANGWGPKPDDFLAVSPRGEVPALIDGDTALYDSTVILEYLEDRYPDPPLYPSDPGQRARARQLEDAADVLIAGEVTALVREVFNKPDAADRDVAAVSAATDAIRRQLDGLEKRLSGGPHLCGAFGVADIGWFLASSFAATLGVPPGPGHAAVAAWLGRVGARPTVASEFRAMTELAARV